jgi:hypothetical protein
MKSMRRLTRGTGQRCRTLSRCRRLSPLFVAVVLFVIFGAGDVVAQSRLPSGAAPGPDRTLAASPFIRDDLRVMPGSKRYVHFLFSGQSLSVGAQGLPVLSTTQPYGNKTFVGGPRSGSSQLFSLIDLVEFESGTRGETTCSGAANYVIELLPSGSPAVTVAAPFDMISSTAGFGGYTIRKLIKGTPAYGLLVDHIRAGFDLSVAAGRTYSVGALGWLQGESDQSPGTKSRLEYKHDLIDYQADVDADVRSITGQTADVMLLSYQLSGYVARGSNYRNVTLAQLDACEENPCITIVSPTYPFPFSDRVHFTNVGYNWIGHYFGKVYKQLIVDRRPWIPLSPKRIVQHAASPEGSGILVEFNVPEPPLVLDTVNLGEATDYGFVVEDGGGVHTITSVTVIDATHIEILVDRPLTGGAILRYALDCQGAGLTLSDGGSGNLRDSDGRTFTIGLTSYNLFNWCVAFEKPIY